MPSPAHLIVTGARRSGTTLMQQVLCSAPTASPQFAEARVIAKLLELFDWGIDAYDRNNQWYFDGPDDFADFVQQSVDRVLANLRRRFPDAETMVLKAPAFHDCLDAADRFIPDVRHVICLRNPFDQALSEHEVELRKIDSDRKRQRREGKRDFRKLAKAYLRQTEPALAYAEAHPERALVSKYEDLVGSPQREVERLSAFTGLDLSGYDPKAAWKGFLFQDEFRDRPTYVEQYGQPIDASRVGRFNDKLTQGDIAAVSGMCDRVLTRHYPDLTVQAR
ncbi:MAG: sulfotransferase [Planctomycetota bacterium]